MRQTDDDRYVPAAITTATSTVASREKRQNATRRSDGAPNQTRPTSAASPPIQSDAAAMCTQSASSVFQDEPASAASWPESESPATRTVESTSAGTSR